MQLCYGLDTGPAFGSFFVVRLPRIPKAIINTGFLFINISMTFFLRTLPIQSTPCCLFTVRLVFAYFSTTTPILRPAIDRLCQRIISSYRFVFCVSRQHPMPDDISILKIYTGMQ